ncbi:MAG: PEGA domain-containing protein, partial [Candidatus Doudnabacteria bacterium]|nr:PEGA domain-containing protein [Candidatus Doudnabacteria bacterium]
MTLRSRVLLIVSGLIIFMIAGPSIVLLARGFRYDFSQNRIVKTGTLVVKTEPRGARVFLNGQELKTTPLIHRFLTPGEYSLEIQKDNYFPWKKRITVHAEQVITINSPDSDEIALFLSSPAIFPVATSTADFVASENGIFYLRDSTIYRVDQGGKNSSLLATSAQKLTSARILSANDNRILIKAADGTYYFSG